jgi:hypothetical protein
MLVSLFLVVKMNRIVRRFFYAISIFVGLIAIGLGYLKLDQVYRQRRNEY